MKTKYLALSAKTVVFEAQPTEWLAAAAGKEPGLPKFSMVAYTGAPVRQGWSNASVVVDMAGIDMPSQRIPVRRDHMMPVGNTEMISIKDGKLIAAGVISFRSPAAEEIAMAGKNGFPWQASIAGPVLAEEEVPADQEVEVNGVKMKGPLFIVRKMRLKEISFVDLGADENTSATVAAKDQPIPDSPELSKAKQEAGIAAANAAAAEDLKRAVMAMCPTGLEAQAQALILVGKNLADIRAELSAALAARTSATVQPNVPAAVTASKPKTDNPTAPAAGAKSISAISDDDLASAF